MTQTRIPIAQLDANVVDKTSAQVLTNKDLSSATNTIPNLTGAVTSTGSATSQIISFNFNSPVSTNGTVILSAYVPFGCNVNGVNQIQCNSGGTFTANFQINTTSITGLGSLSVTSTPQNATATAARTITAGNSLNLVITSASSLTQAIFSLSLTRS